jgi:hypothetical protein
MQLRVHSPGELVNQPWFQHTLWLEPQCVQNKAPRARGRGCVGVGATTTPGSEPPEGMRPALPCPGTGPRPPFGPAPLPGAVGGQTGARVEISNVFGFHHQGRLPWGRCRCARLDPIQSTSWELTIGYACPCTGAGWDCGWGRFSGGPCREPPVGASGQTSGPGAKVQGASPPAVHQSGPVRGGVTGTWARTASRRGTTVEPRKHDPSQLGFSASLAQMG